MRADEAKGGRCTTRSPQLGRRHGEKRCRYRDGQGDGTKKDICCSHQEGLPQLSDRPKRGSREMLPWRRGRCIFYATPPLDCLSTAANGRASSAHDIVDVTRAERLVFWAGKRGPEYFNLE